jgi:hypothetical protein
MGALSVLDSYLEAALHVFDLEDSVGASKEDHDRANVLLSDRERSFIAYTGLNTDDQNDSDVFDRILELVEAYRNDESQYKTLVDYVETVRKK